MRRSSMRCRSVINTCWLYCRMVPETLILLLGLWSVYIATVETVNLIGPINSGRIQTTSTSKTVSTPHAHQTSVGQREKDPPSREVPKKITLMTNATSFKGSQPNESVKTFQTGTGSVDSFRFQNNDTVGIYIRKPAPSGVGWGFLYRTRNAVGKENVRSRRQTKRNTIRNGGNAEVGNQSKEKGEAGANVKKVTKKRVKKTKKPGQKRNDKHDSQKSSKSVSANKRLNKGPIRKPHKGPSKGHIERPIQRHHEGLIQRHHEGPIQRHHEGPIQKHHEGPIQRHHEGPIQKHHEGPIRESSKADDQGSMQETGYESQSPVRKARYADEDDDYYDSYDGGDDDAAYGHDEECDQDDEEPVVDGPECPHDHNKDTIMKKHKGSLRHTAEGLGIGSEDISRRSPKRAHHKDRKHGRGERRRKGHKKYKGRHRVRPRLQDYDHLDYNDVVGQYDHDYYEFHQRTKRESGDGEERPQPYVSSNSLGLIPALNQVKDSWTSFGMNAKVKNEHRKRTGARSINGTTSHLPVLSANQNYTAAAEAGVNHDGNQRTGKRIKPSVTVKRPSAPVLISLCSADGVGLCANGGTCLRSAIRGIICICPTGFSGKTCDNRTDPCNSHPCQNGATCTFAAKPPFMRCQCPSGFTGKLCQIDVNECASEPCLNGAWCLNHVDGFSCKCLPGFEGQRCQNNTDDCLGRICANGGRCVDGLNRYRCQCRPGFFGRHCQRVSDACLRSPCFNGGECIAMDSRGHFYKCLCRTGYLGARCEIQAARCVHTWCQNGGTCMEATGSFQCLCPSGLTGNLCESELSSAVQKCHPDVCQRRGTCVDAPTGGYRCECPSEAVGDRCQFDRVACLPNPCLNSGLCIPTGGPFYFCLCDQRFAGKHCQFETRPCAKHGTCQNGGTCLEYHLLRRRNHRLRRSCVGEKCRVKRKARKEWTVIRCVCPVLFTGPRCTVRNLPCTIGVCGAGQECQEDANNPVEGYSCTDKTQNEFPLGNVTNWNKTVQEASVGPVHRAKISKTAAISIGAAMIVAIFGIAFIANGYTLCPCFRSKEDGVYQPVPTDSPQIIFDIRNQMENPKT